MTPVEFSKLYHIYCLETKGENLQRENKIELKINYRSNEKSKIETELKRK